MEDLPIIISSVLGSGALAFFIVGLVAVGLLCLFFLVIAESFFTISEERHKTEKTLVK